MPLRTKERKRHAHVHASYGYKGKPEVPCLTVMMEASPSAQTPSRWPPSREPGDAGRAEAAAQRPPTWSLGSRLRSLTSSVTLQGP